MNIRNVEMRNVPATERKSFPRYFDALEAFEGNKIRVDRSGDQHWWYRHDSRTKLGVYLSPCKFYPFSSDQSCRQEIRYLIRGIKACRIKKKPRSKFDLCSHISVRCGLYRSGSCQKFGKQSRLLTSLIIERNSETNKSQNRTTTLNWIMSKNFITSGTSSNNL